MMKNLSTAVGTVISDLHEQCQLCKIPLVRFVCSLALLVAISMAIGYGVGLGISMGS